MTPAPTPSVARRPRPRRRAGWPAALLALLLVLTGCGAQQSGPEQRTSVTVFAAASLKAAFTEIAKQDPTLDVRFSFEGSSTLVDQLVGGAPADVFASADAQTMARAQQKGLLAHDPTTFATNHLVLVVAPGNPKKITGLNATLDGRSLVVCAPQVPCGSASHTLAARVGYTLRPVSEENKVTDVLGKVTSGEADAGLVYVTDATGAGAKVTAVTIPEAAQLPNAYPIARLASATNRPGADRFIALVTSAAGQEALARFGFSSAPS